jgi:hypothetical protein
MKCPSCQFENPENMIFCCECGQLPLCRDILNEIGFIKDQVYEMFPYGHKSAYKLAGLPKPPQC